MGVIAVSGEPGCPLDEVARVAAQRLRFELINEAALRKLLAQEFQSETAVPEKAWVAAVGSVLARLATEHHLVLAFPGAEQILRHYSNAIRIFLKASEARRIGAMMIDHRMERPAAKALLKHLETAQQRMFRERFGRVTPKPEHFDLICNTDTLDVEPVALLIETAATARGLIEEGLISPSAEAHLQFQLRLQLAKHGIQPVGHARIHKVAFVHPSEEMFANLLDFYRIQWEYEPRSFPVQMDADGRVLEAFTPDFYLPEFDLYVELTTMKQSLVTKKNRKVKLLKAIYPHLNIQVFYQKDFQDLIFKYGLSDARPELVNSK